MPLLIDLRRNLKNRDQEEERGREEKGDYPPFPEDGNVEDVRKWNDECHEVSKIIKKIEKG